MMAYCFFKNFYIMSLISGNATFYGNSKNSSTDLNTIIGTPLFLDNSSNEGILSTGIFSGSAFNAGEIQVSAIFLGSAVNSGIVATATFNEGSVNLGTVTNSGLFFGTAVNSGIVSGNAIFADTTTNNGTVEGDADFAVGASNEGGTVNGNIGVYVPQNWYDDASSADRTVALDGVVTQSDEGGGVKAANFSNSRLRYASTTALETSDFTLEFFVKSDLLAPSFREAYFTTLGTVSNGGFEIFKNADGTISLGSFYVSLDLTSTATITDTNWHHIAVVGVGGEVSLFIDGVKDSTITKNYTGAGEYAIGQIDTFNSQFYGKIAGLRLVIGTALHTGSTYTIPTTLPTAISGTELLLNFGATQAPTVVGPNWYDDTSSATHEVTLNGTVTSQSDEGSGVLAAQFDNGSDGLVMTDTDIVDFGTGDFTVEFFIKPASTSYGTVFDNRTGIYLNNNFHVAWFDGAIRYVTNNNSGNIGPSEALTVGVWSHIAVVRSSGYSVLYVNGIAAEAPWEDGRNLNDIGSLYIGKTYDNDNYSFNGKLAGIRIVKGTAIYTSDFAVPTDLPTAVTGTELLLNFGATVAPTVMQFFPTSVLSETTNWVGVKPSPDGSKVIAWRTINGHNLHQAYISRNSGANFSLYTVTGGYYSYIMDAIISSDGNTIHLITRNTSVRKSTNAGQTWTELPVTYNEYIQDMTISDDGAYAVISGESGSGGIYYSTDGLLNWTASSTPGYNRFTSISATRDGSKVIAISHDTDKDQTGPAFSTDYGASFITFNIATAGWWAGAAMSSNASKMVAAQKDGSLWISIDQGSTWTAKLVGTSSWSGVAISASGQVMAAVTSSGDLYISRDYGSNWSLSGSVNLTVDIDRSAISMTDDGSVIYIRTAGKIFHTGAAAPIVPNWYDDSSSAARTVALNGTVTQEDEGSGVIAALLDGSLDYLSTSNINFGNNQFTIEGFFKPNSLNQMSVLFGSSNGPYNQPKLVAYVYNGNLKVELINESTQSSLEAPLSNIKLNEWNHIALIRDGGYNALYINGVHVDNAPFQSTTGITAPFYVGWAGEIDSFDGLIAGFRVVVGTALYGGATLTIPTSLPTDVSGTELLLNFGATAAPTVTASNWYDDSSSAARTVTLNGTVTQSDEGSGVIAADFAAGRLTTTLTAIGTDDYTFETFVKLDANSGYRGNVVADFRAGNDTNNALIYFGGAGGSSGDAYKDLDLYAGGQHNMTTAITDSVWHHVAVTRSSGTSRMYIDGVKVGETSVSYDITNTGLIIGDSINFATETADQLQGKLAGYRIIKGTALYTGSTYTIPTTLPTDVSGTELLLNFGASAVPAVPHPDGAYTDGYYTNGVIDTNYTCAVPQLTQDSSCYATYAAGIGSAANGAYADFLYGNGYKQTDLCVYNGCMADSSCRAWIYRGGGGCGLNPMDIYTSQIQIGDYCYPAVSITCSTCIYSNGGDGNCMTYCQFSCNEYLCTPLPIIGGAFYNVLKTDVDHYSCLVFQSWSCYTCSVCTPVYDEYSNFSGYNTSNYYCNQYSINTFIFGSNGQPACFLYYNCEVQDGVIVNFSNNESLNLQFFMPSLCGFAPYMNCIS